MSIPKIVLTGGPCGGKSTALKLLDKELSKKGYTVIKIFETATELSACGINKSKCSPYKEFQKNLLLLQLDKEKAIEAIVKSLQNSKIVILLDRGAMDSKAYLSDEEFAELLQELNLSEQDLIGRYSAVYHLVTAADGALEYYTTKNNSARCETPEEAILIDNKTFDAWKSHNNLKRFDNKFCFDKKINNVLQEIIHYLDIHC